MVVSLGAVVNCQAGGYLDRLAVFKKASCPSCSPQGSAAFGFFLSSQGRLGTCCHGAGIRCPGVSVPAAALALILL